MATTTKIEKNKFKVYSIGDNTTKQETPVVAICDRLSPSMLKEGMIVFSHKTGYKYRLKSFLTEEKEEGSFKYKVSTIDLIHIKKDGTDGEPISSKITASNNKGLLIKLADIKEEHQELFYDGQEVEGKIVKEEFSPEKHHLRNWRNMFESFYRIKRKFASYDKKENLIEIEIWEMIDRTIMEIGTARFNEYINYFFVGKKNKEEAYYEAHKALRQYYDFGDDKAYALSMLYKLMGIEGYFYEGVRSVVFEEGMKFDYDSIDAKRI